MAKYGIIITSSPIDSHSYTGRFVVGSMTKYKQSNGVVICDTYEDALEYSGDFAGYQYAPCKINSVMCKALRKNNTALYFGFRELP